MIIISFFTIGGKLDIPLDDEIVAKQIIKKIRESKNPIVDITEFCEHKDLPITVNKNNLCFNICGRKSDIATPAKKIQTPGNLGINCA